MADTIKSVFTADTAKNILIPPPGTNDAVKGLYYAQNAQMGLAAVKGVGLAANKVISTKIAQKIAQSIISKATQAVINNVRQSISKAISELIAKMLGKSVAVAGAKLGASGASHAALLSTSPVGAIVDAILMCVQVFGLLFMLFDKSGISFVMDKAFIYNITHGMNKALDDAYTKNGMPGYYSDEATFPVLNFIFETDKTGNTTLTKGWGSTYLKFQDEYMASKGFKSNWRDSVKVTPPPTAPPPVSITSIIIFLVIMFFFILMLGGIYYVVTK